MASAVRVSFPAAAGPKNANTCARTEPAGITGVASETTDCGRASLWLMSHPAVLKPPRTVQESQTVEQDGMVGGKATQADDQRLGGTPNAWLTKNKNRR
jgi:hypothetical protein